LEEGEVKKDLPGIVGQVQDRSRLPLKKFFQMIPIVMVKRSIQILPIGYLRQGFPRFLEKSRELPKAARETHSLKFRGGLLWKCSLASGPPVFRAFSPPDTGLRSRTSRE